METLDTKKIQLRSELIKKRLTPTLDVLVLANMKIEQYKNSGQDVPPTLFFTRDKMYDLSLEILKSEGP